MCLSALRSLPALNQCSRVGGGLYKPLVLQDLGSERGLSLKGTALMQLFSAAGCCVNPMKLIPIHRRRESTNPRMQKYKFLMSK